MALRAGYHGVKRNVLDELEKLDGILPAGVSKNNKLVTEQDINASVDLIDETVGWIGGNLFNGVATSETSQGVTWSVDANDNNIITISGTPTGYKAFAITSTNVLPAGDYIFTGVSETENISWNRIVLIKNGAEVRSSPGVTTNQPITFTILETDDYDTIKIELKRIANNVACSGTVKLMVLRPEVSQIISYQPYHASVDSILSDHKTTINAIIAAATEAADFAAFKAAMEAITPVTRSAAPAATREVIEEEPVTVKKTTRKKSTAAAETEKEGE